MPGYVYRGNKPLHLEADDTTATRDECGTWEGVNIHRRLDEQPCDPCRELRIARHREYKEARRKKANK